MTVEADREGRGKIRIREWGGGGGGGGGGGRDSSTHNRLYILRTASMQVCLVLGDLQYSPVFSSIL